MDAFKLALQSGFLGIMDLGTVMKLSVKSYVMANQPPCIGRRVVLPLGGTPDWADLCDLSCRLGLSRSYPDSSGPIDEVDVP